MTITLYDLCGADESHRFSPHCWKTRLSLRHKGLDFETVPVPFTKIADVEGGASKTVPVIRDGDRVVGESFAIARYLDEAYPDRPLLGSAEVEALTSFLISWSHGTVHPVVARMALVDIHDALAEDDKAYFRKTREALFGMSLEDFVVKRRATTADLEAAVAPLAATLKRQLFLGGEGPLFADYVVFGPLQWLRTIQGDGALPAEGPVREWFDRLLDMYDGEGRNTKLAA